MPQLAIATCLTGTISNTAVALAALTGYDAATHGTANRAVIGVATDAIRVTWNGTAPTTTVGHHIAVNGTLTIEGAAKVAALKFIRITTDAAITITLESV